MLRKTILLIALIATHLSLTYTTAGERNGEKETKIIERKGLTVVPDSSILYTTEINEER